MSQIFLQEPDNRVLLLPVAYVCARLLKKDTATDHPDVDVRLEEFRNLRDGWLEDGGKAPNHDGLDWLRGAFGRYYPKDLPQPHTYPTPEGGISLEWTMGRLDVDIEVNLERHTGWWYVFNKDTSRGESEKTLNLDDRGGWQWISEQLRNLMG